MSGRQDAQGPMNLNSTDQPAADAQTVAGTGADQAMTIHQIRERLAAATSEEAVAARSKKRQTTHQVRQAREKLTSSTGTRPAFDSELLRIYATNRMSAALTMFALQFFVAGAMLMWVPPVAAASWLGGVMVTHAIVLVMARQFLKPEGRQVALKSWERRFAVAEGCHALTWAIMVPMLGLEQLEAARLFILVVMILVVSIHTLIGATQSLATYAGSLPITLATIGFFAVQGGGSAIAVAILMPIAQVFFIAFGARMKTSTLATLEFRSEKDALFGELEQAKANSDEARRRAEAASLAKSRFLATMSHELRTPLNAILGFSEVMKTEVFGVHTVPAYKEYSVDIHASGQHLLNLINEILDLSRIEAERYELNEEAVSLTHIAEDCHHLLKLRAKNRGIIINEVYEPNMPLLWADERALRQVVLNLLSNAIKFTPQGGEVTITVGWTSEGGQYLSVNDTGPGIPEDEIPTVLSSFGQGTLAIKTAEQGTGLGLPIVKGLIDLHGGAFKLTSKLREGTQVLIALPPSRVMAALAPLQAEQKPLKMSRVS